MHFRGNRVGESDAGLSGTEQSESRAASRRHIERQVLAAWPALPNSRIERQRRAGQEQRCVVQKPRWHENSLQTRNPELQEKIRSSIVTETLHELTSGRARCLVRLCRTRVAGRIEAGTRRGGTPLEPAGEDAWRYDSETSIFLV
jgi:hypothetical protein